MVEVLYDGNLGNNLFQYCFGRILAERLGYRLIAKPIPGFPGTHDVVDGYVCADGQRLTLRGQKPDLTFLDDHREPRHCLLLTGYFQRYEYYRPHVGRIRKWLATHDAIDAPVGKDDVVLSIRRGRDYIPRYGLPVSYYEEAVALCQPDRVHICTNEPSDPFVLHLARKFSAKIRPGGFQGGKVGPSHLQGAIDNFVFIKKFRKIVMSNSSFAWWAGFLSDADLIIGPRPQSGMWAPGDPVSKNIDLEVGEERYRYIECEKYRSEFVGEAIRVFRDETVRRGKAAMRRVVAPLLGRPRTGASASGLRFHEEDDS